MTMRSPAAIAGDESVNVPTLVQHGVLGIEERQEDGVCEEGEGQEGEEEPPSALKDAMRRGRIRGFASYVTFHWAGPFMQLGSSRTLREEDLLGINMTCKR